MTPDITLPKTPTVKTYIALLTQSSTNAPTAIILNEDDNNYLGDITWTYVNVGHYLGTITGKLTEEKTTFKIQNNYSTDSIYIIASQTPPNSCYIQVAYLNGASFTLTNNQLDFTPIEINVYT